MTHLETKGGTKIVTADGKEADGLNAHFDLKANQVIMDGPGGVTLRQGQNFTQGTRLRMDLTRGEAHIESGPGGAPGNAAPTPAQLSIAAKPGVAPPTQPTGCPGGAQQCMIIYPDQLNQSGIQTSKSPKPAGGEAAAKTKPALDPQVSPSAVYRSN